MSSNDRTSPCPYCNTLCICDLVDVGVGEIQCGLYFCENCGASEIGPEVYQNPAVKFSLTEFERKCGWYGPGKPVSPHANTFNGELVDHRTAKPYIDQDCLTRK